jgi:hypothetical protein
MADLGYRPDNDGYGGAEARRQLDVLADMNLNWVAVTDHLYMPDLHRPELRGRQARPEAMTRFVTHARNRGIQVLFKPHIWSRSFWGGTTWHGSIEMRSEADWQAFFKNYGDWIVEHARVAQAAGAGAFCVGTELQGTVHREAEWRELIRRVREVFEGPLTYSASFGEWEQITWWDALDCVSITAYWPIVPEDREPTEAAIRAGWRDIFARLEPFKARVGRPIVFTELGYTASGRAHHAPWEHHEVAPDPALQARLYRVSLDEIARSGVVDGVLLWKWFTADHRSVARTERDDAFALQARPEAVTAIREAWQVED